MKLRQLQCSVPDCVETARYTASISINSAPKKRLAVCKQHRDAAREDVSEAKRSVRLIGVDQAQPQNVGQHTKGES